MYYKLIFDDGIYYSKPVLMSFLHTGDSGFSRAVLSGEVQVREVLGRAVYTLPALNEQTVGRIDKEFFPRVQLVSETIRGIKDCRPASGDTRWLYICDGAEILEYAGERFVKLSEVRSRALYRDQWKLPTIDVCGTRYVALGKVVDGENISVGTV